MPRRTLHWSAHDVATRCTITNGVVHLRTHPEEAVDSEHLKTRIVGYARALGDWRWYFTEDSRRSPTGYPDLILLRRPQSGRSARQLIIECKNTHKDYPRADQQAWLEDYWLQGCEVYILSPSDEPEIPPILQATVVTTRSTAWMTRCRFPMRIERDHECDGC